MDIFNTIWTAISTPNENLINLLILLLSFVENYLVMTLFLSISNIEATKKQKTFYICSMVFLGFFDILFVPEPYNFFLNYLAMIILTYIVFTTSFIKSLVAVVASCLIFNIVSALSLNPYLTLFNISSLQLESIPIYRFLYMLIAYTIFYATIFIVKKLNWSITFNDEIDKKSKITIILNFILGFFTLFIQVILAIYYTDTLPLIITFFSFISLLAFFSISIYSLIKVFQLTSTTKKLQSAEEYNNTLRILHDNVRGFKHDFDNIVTTIGGYIKTNDMEGLKKYYVQLEDDCQRVNNFYLLNPNVVNNDGIYNLLTKKYYEADEKDIKVNLTFLLDLSTLNMKIYEFARILGILLDNAIEASSECENKIINLTFRNDAKNSRQLVIIENTYNQEDLDIDKIFEKGVSKKENHTGLGLWEVRKILKKNNNINLYTKKTDTLFTQQLEIYY